MLNVNVAVISERNPRTARTNARKREKRKKLALNPLEREGKKAHISTQSRHAHRGRLVQTGLDAAGDLKYSGPAFKGKRATDKEMLETVQKIEGFTYVPSRPG